MHINKQRNGIDASRCWAKEETNAPPGLCKTADGFAQLPHALFLGPFQKNKRRELPESLISDPQILRRRQFGIPPDFVVVQPISDAGEEIDLFGAHLDVIDISGAYQE